MKSFTIRSNASIGSDLFVKARNLQSVATTFGNTIGLLIVKEEFKKDGEGTDYVTFTIGTGMSFYAYPTPAED